MIAKGADIDRFDILVLLGLSGLSLRTSIGIFRSSGSFGSAFFGLFIGLLGQIMRGLMVSHSFVLGRVIMVWVLMGIGVILSIFLLLVVIETIPTRDVFEAEDVLGPFGWKVLIWDKHAIGVRSSLVFSKIGHALGIPLDAALGTLLGDQLVTGFGFVGVERTYNTGYDIEIHGVASHGEEFTFSLGPFPQFGLHALGSQGFMAPHSPSSLEQPVAIGPSCQETWDARLALGEPPFFNLDSVDDLFVRSAFLDVE